MKEESDGWPVPDDPTLRDAARALEAHGFAGELWDRDWRLAYLTTEYRLLVSAGRYHADVPGRGEFFLSPAMCAARDAWPTGPTFESMRDNLPDWGGFLMATVPVSREDLIEAADPRLRAVLRTIEPAPAPPMWSIRVDVRFGREIIGNDVLITSLHDDAGARAGYSVVVKPEIRAGVLGMLALGDARLFERMSSLLEPARRPAAIVFADVEGSSSLARRLSTAAYFKLIRRIASAADRAIVERRGIVGKHVGDGVTAFFLAENAASESAAARAAIEATSAIRAAAHGAAERSGLEPNAVTMRFGLHWGSTLYVGRLLTSGRAEVTALGDEVNETARIEACATGARTLASKTLIERLDRDDATALGLDPAGLSYTPLAELPTAGEKARRDAPAIAVCEL